MRLFFQPVVDIATRRVHFHETLLRLQRANGTFAPATDFIELSEQLGLIRLIDEYTLGRALEALTAFPAAHLSLNVSGETVGDAVWLSSLAEALLGRPDLAEDPQYATNGDRCARRQALDEAITSWTRTQPARTAEAALEAADVPCSRLFDIADCATEIEHRPEDDQTLRRLGKLIDEVRDFIAAINR